VRGASGAALWTRSDLRARGVSLFVLGALTGLTVGLAAAALDGARRTDTALTRLEAKTNASDAVVFASQAGLTTPDWSTLAHRPEVEQLARWGLAFGNVDGDEDGVLFMPMDDAWLSTVDKPIVVAGRMFDPHATDEVVLSDDVPNSEGGTAKVGDVIHFAPTPLDATGGTESSAAPLEMRVVGIVHTPLSYVFTGGAFLTPGYGEKYGDVALIAENAMIRLHGNDSDIGALRRDANSDIAQGVPVLDFHVTGRRVTATTDVEGTMLRVLAAIVALAGVAFVGQALARSAATIGSDAPTLRAMGMTRRELVSAGVRPHLLTASVAVVVAAVTVVVASRWFPVGLAADVDSDRGIQVNLVTMAITVGLAALLTVVVAVTGAWRASRSSDARTVRSGVLLAHLPIARPVTSRVGARMAFESGGSNRKTAAWPALIGAAAAVAGVTAIITVNSGLTDAITHPEVAGVNWDATVIPSQDDVSVDKGVKSTVVEAVADQPGVDAVSTIGRYVGDIGDLGVPVFTVIDPPAGRSVHIVTLSGREPRDDDEIVLGPSTASDLHVEVGDSVELSDGGSARVVGLGLFPSDVHAQFDEGAWILPDRWSRLAAQNFDPTNNDTVDMFVAVRFAGRHHLDDQITSLATGIGSAAQAVFPADQPLELANLHNVRTLPTVLAVFLAVLGAVAVGHALFSSAYRRRRDFAVLQALGVTRRGIRAIVTTQATVVGAAGLIVGVPLGLIAGRAGWRAITDRVPLTFRSPLAVLAVVIVIPVALLAANVLAIIPARRASKVEPALVLRSE
jgi:ABC-type lipoprotein release transport system permease subunit